MSSNNIDETDVITVVEDEIHKDVKDEPITKQSRSGRAIKTLISIAPPPTRKRQKKVVDDDYDDDKDDHNEWICTACELMEHPNGSDLLLCDGPCLRSYHLDCIPQNERPKVYYNNLIIFLDINRFISIIG
jgi:hypothetical protein